MASVDRLCQIEQEILRLEDEKLQLEQTLALFWEHLPPIDPEVVKSHMLQIRNRIRGLEDRKGALLAEKESLIVEWALRNGGGN